MTRRRDIPFHVATFVAAAVTERQLHMNLNRYVTWADVRWLAVWLVTLALITNALVFVFQLELALVLCVVAGYAIRRYAIVDKMLAWGDRTRDRTRRARFL